MFMRLTGLTFVASLAFAGTALAAAPVSSLETAIGVVLTDEAGMTLYTFQRDEVGMTNCYESCAANWPPFIADEGAMAEGEYSLVTRTDGSLQWAKDGWPLYYWVNDLEPGDVSGDGVGGVWDVARP